jgi:hypothetical protein
VAHVSCSPLDPTPASKVVLQYRMLVSLHEVGVPTNDARDMACGVWGSAARHHIWDIECSCKPIAEGFLLSTAHISTFCCSHAQLAAAALLQLRAVTVTDLLQLCYSVQDSASFGSAVVVVMHGFELRV